MPSLAGQKRNIIANIYKCFKTDIEMIIFYEYYNTCFYFYNFLICHKIKLSCKIKIASEKI